MSELTDRLRGQYQAGDSEVTVKRDFSAFIPAISLEAANKIDELQAEIERLSTWVSVEDGLPEDDGRYLTSDGTDWWTANFFDQDRGWSEFNKIIAHWMPIPEIKE